MLSRAALVVVLVASNATCSRCSSDDANRSGAAPSATSATTNARTGSCDRVALMSLCSEYSGGYLAQNEAVLSSGCGKLSGTFVAAECPNTNVLGSCLLATGEVRKFYASGKVAYDLPRAKKECEETYRGKWSAF